MAFNCQGKEGELATVKNEVDSNKDRTTRRTALIAAMASSFLSPFLVSAVNVALPAIAAEFRINAVSITLVSMAYVLPGAIFALPFGKLADIYGRKAAFISGLAFLSVCTAFCGVSTSGSMLLIIRLLQGLGSAMVWGNGVAMLTSIFPPSDRGKVIGLAIASVYAGLSLGPPVGGFLTEQWGWRSIFFLSGALGSVFTVTALLGLKGEWAEAKGERFDVIGSLTYCLSLTGVMYGLNKTPALPGILFLLAGLAGLYLFLKWEARIKNPVLDWRLFRNNPIFAFSNLAMFVNYAATYSIGFLMSLYLQYSKHLSPKTAGLILVTQPVMQVLFSPSAGKLSDKVKPQRVAALGMCLTVVGLVCFVFLQETTPLWLIIGTLALHGLGFALFASPNTNAVMGSVEKRFYGVASGISSTMRLLGNSFSLSIAMLIFSLCIGQVQITPERSHAFLKAVSVIFAIFALLSVSGVLASLVGARHPTGTASPRAHNAVRF